MPLRQQELQPLCSVCRGSADETCKRCGAPACDIHAPDSDHRCVDCEKAFQERHHKLIAHAALSQARTPSALLGIAAYVLAIFLYLAGSISGSTTWLAIAGVVLYFLLIGPGVSRLRLRGKRRRFLNGQTRGQS